MLLVKLGVLAGAKPLLGPALLFWSVQCHDWRHIWKTCYSETMMEISCTRYSRRILKIWDPFQDMFSFFLSHLIVQKRFVHFIVNSSHLGRSWRQLSKKLQMQLGALRGAAIQPDPAVGQTSLIDFNLRQRSIMIYVWICEMITVSTIVDDTVISWSCKAWIRTPISMWMAWIPLCARCTCIRLWQSSVWNQDLVIALEPIPAYHLLFPSEMI